MKRFLCPVLSLMALLGLTLQAQNTAMPEVPAIAAVPSRSAPGCCKHRPGEDPCSRPLSGQRSAGGPRPGYSAGANWQQSTSPPSSRLAGARPAGENGTYFQKVPLMAVHTEVDKTSFTFVPSHWRAHPPEVRRRLHDQGPDRCTERRHRRSHRLRGLRHRCA